MKRLFELAFRFSGGNLHIAMKGYFDCRAAERLAALLAKEHAGAEKFFVNASSLDGIDEGAATRLQTALQQLPVRAEQFFFKGEQGRKLASSGNRVLILPHCEHRCAHCNNCHGHAQHLRYDPFVGACAA